jgi:signal transduction histidine kinase
MHGKTENLEQFENRIVTCEGIEKTILWHNEILRDENGNITGALCSGEDITERKEAEQMLLQNELHLRKLNATKDKLFSVIAHDLKGPFSNIVGFSTLLNDEFDKFQTSEIKEFVNIISRSAVQTMQLLDNLLDWSRLQQKGIIFNPANIDLTELINDILEQTKGQAGAKGIKLINLVYETLICFADENMLKIIIRNLVSNAVKFTNQGGRVVVNAVKTDNFTEISVTDNGVGIQSENIEKLFKIESEISTRGTASETGTGLGLILCREFVEKHSGNIKVESTPGKGSKFSFTIRDKQAS